MKNFIEEICVGTPNDSKPLKLKLAYPVCSDSTNCITVIAGKNRTGKSHILINAFKGLCVHNTNLERGVKGSASDKYVGGHSNVSLQLVDNSVPVSNPLLLTDMHFLMKKTASAPLQDVVIKTGDIGTKIEPRIHEAFVKFTGEQISKLDHGFKVKFDNESWRIDSNYRQSFISQLDKKYLYRCLNQTEVLKLFEEATGLALYLKNTTKGIRLFLRSSSTHTMPMNEWSHGQRALLIYLVLIKYCQHDVLFVDEMENHLHPEYISILCKFIKKTTPQALLVTHNPHLIFSRYVDKVWFIEVASSPSIHPNVINHEDRIPKVNMSTLNRSLYSLDSDVDKISKSYHLFENVDSQLLRLSQTAVSHLNDTIVEMFKKVFEYEVVSASPRKSPDMQNDKFVDILIQKIREKPEGIRVLDYSTGTGRTLQEANKRFIPKIGGPHRWTLWEPNPTLREELKQSIAGTADKVIIPDSLDVNLGLHDIVLIANVLHECNPDDFGKIIRDSQALLEEDGQIVIIEMCPLLSPEKYAVAYTESELAEIMFDSGYTTQSSSLNIKNASISAYWIKARKSNKKREAIEPEESVKKVWKKVLKRCCIQYEGRWQIDSPEQMTKMMNELTTIASIQSYYQNCWDCF